MNADNHIHAEFFTSLFRHRRRNHAQICLGLRTIVQGMTASYHFATDEDREDFVGDALAYAIERIDRFKFRAGGNAYSYYRAVFANFFLRIGRRVLGRREREAKTFTALKLGMLTVEAAFADWTRVA